MKFDDHIILPEIVLQNEKRHVCVNGRILLLNSIIHSNLHSLSIIHPQEGNYSATINMKPTQHYPQQQILSRKRKPEFTLYILTVILKHINLVYSILGKE